MCAFQHFCFSLLLFHNKLTTGQAYSNSAYNFFLSNTLNNFLHSIRHWTKTVTRYAIHIPVGTDFYTLQYVNTSVNFTCVHLAGSVHFLFFWFKFVYIISGLKVSIGTRAQQVFVQRLSGL